MPIPLIALTQFLTPARLKFLGISAVIVATLGVAAKGGHYLGTLSANAACQTRIDDKDKIIKTREDEIKRLQNEALTAKSKAEKALSDALSSVDAEKARSSAERKKLLDEFLAKRRAATVVPTLAPTVEVPPGSSVTPPTAAPSPTLVSFPPCFNSENIQLINFLLEKSNASGFFSTTPTR